MKRRRIIYVLVAILILGMFWFLCVDRSQFQESCPDCFYHRSVVQYRVLGVPIYETAEESDSLLGLIARDLGAPCQHPHYIRLHQYRWWGLCYLTLPIGEEIETSVSGPKRWIYDEKKRRKVRQMAVDNPSLGTELRQRVIFDKDWEYWDEFIDQLLGNKKKQRDG